MTWQLFEDRIRDIARFRWNCNATTETIAGVKCDCVLKVHPDEWIVVEITVENSLTKVRSDISKLLTVRNSCYLKNIFCRCFFVMRDKPTDSMRAAGSEQNIFVMSGEEFQNEYFEYGSYIHSRRLRQFGSLIDLETGQPENNTYIDVFYSNTRSGKELSVLDIIELLKKGKRIILKGDFGLGKSRCIKQIFDVLVKDPVNNPYTIAINLRDHWGAKRANEIVTRHFQELGLPESHFICTFDQPNTVYLLDGFDEIGTQSWSSDINKMRHIREMSVCALKELINKVNGGVLITGREYYFNSDSELLNCLGLSEAQTVFLECHNEFTEAELLNYISLNAPTSTLFSEEKRIESLPDWFPKRPLVIQMLMKYAIDVFTIKHALEDICGFWYVFLSKICEREARIYPALNPEVIKCVLISLAEHTRLCPNNTGPITQSDLSEAFRLATGLSPSDESSIMLQRLPSLGRISDDSPDRRFLDSFVLNGLRAEGIIQLSKSWDNNILDADWIHPLDLIGLTILSEYIEKDERRLETFLGMARTASHSRNMVLAADIVSAICLLNVETIDFREIYIEGGYFSNLSFEGKEVLRLSIADSIIEKIDFTNSKLSNTVSIQRCSVGTAYGIASRKSVPPQLIDCDVASFETLSTTTLIKCARLSDSQKIFVEMLRKIFFQPGAGRKEAALMRGMGASVNRQLGQRILNKMMDEKLIERIKGDEGYVYKPVRKNTARVDRILTDLTLSEDPIWAVISDIA